MALSGMHYHEQVLRSDAPPHVDLNSLTFDETGYEGEELWFSGFVREKRVEDNYSVLVFKTSYGSTEARLPRGVQVGEGSLVALRGEFREGELRVEGPGDVHVIGFRRFRYVVSFFAGLFVLALSLKGFRFTWEGFEVA